MKNNKTFTIKVKEGIWKYWLEYDITGKSFISAVKRVK